MHRDSLAFAGVRAYSFQTYEAEPHKRDRSWIDLEAMLVGITKDPTDCITILPMSPTDAQIA